MVIVTELPFDNAVFKVPTSTVDGLFAGETVPPPDGTEVVPPL